MTAKQYQVLADLFHEFNRAFLALPRDIRREFYAILYQHKAFTKEEML